MENVAWTTNSIAGADAQPTFGTTTVSTQTYTSGALIVPLTLPAASEGDGTLIYSLSPSVPGLTFNPSTGSLTGTLSIAGTRTTTYTVTDADGDVCGPAQLHTGGLVVNRASVPTETTGEHMPGQFRKVRPDGITIGQFGAGECIVFGANFIASSKWQRRAHPDSPWVDVPETEQTGRVCPYEPTEPRQYRQVGVINVEGEIGLWPSSSCLPADP